MDSKYFIGYHATTSDRVNSILTNNFVPTRRKASWLGWGSYFFFEAPNHAANWALEAAARRSRSLGYTVEGVIFKVAIDLANAINLLDGDYWPLLKTAYTNVPADIRQVGPGFRYLGGDIPPEVGWNYRDCMAVNAFVEALEQEGIPCDVIVAAFAEGEPLDPTSWLFDRSSVIISVRNSSAVSIMDQYSVP